MKVDIVPLSREYYEELFKLAKLAEPFEGFHYYDKFCQDMDVRVGFTYWIGDKIVGLMSFTDYLPGVSVLIHAMFHPKFRSALGRKAIRHIFDYAFNTLLVQRISAISIEGVTDVVKFLEGVGFVREGCIRKSMELANGIFDVTIYGMLREECKWI